MYYLLCRFWDQPLQCRICFVPALDVKESCLAQCSHLHAVKLLHEHLSCWLNGHVGPLSLSDDQCLHGVGQKNLKASMTQATRNELALT